MTPYLPDHEARCRPGCTIRRDTCGRFLAPLPQRGATVVDGAAQQQPWAPCQLYVPASECKLPPAQPRRVHPAW